MNPEARAAELERRILASIPLARAMQLRVRSFDGQRVLLSAPLAPNLNDKGTGFAGSLSTLVTLSGWSLATLLGEQALSRAFPGDGIPNDDDGARCEAAVVHAELDFLRPVRADLEAGARLADAEILARLHARLQAGKRVKVPVVAWLGPEHDPVVLFRGDYALWRAGTQPF